MSQRFQVLAWDSAFFEIKVAQLEKNLFLKGDMQSCVESLVDQDVELAYYISDKPLNEDVNIYYDFILVNKRVPIEKKLSSVPKMHEKVTFYSDPIPDKNLLDLAQRAGVCSRFNLDPNIHQKKVQELYKIWISKSVQKEMAEEVLVYREKGEIKGFVTLQINPPQGKTPLFAVDHKAEGKGVSFALMRAADTVLYERGCSYYTSATQAENKAALTIFRRHGVKIKPIEYVYHLWRK